MEVTINAPNAEVVEVNEAPELPVVVREVEGMVISRPADEGDGDGVKLDPTSRADILPHPEDKYPGVVVCTFAYGRDTNDDAAYDIADPLPWAMPTTSLNGGNTPMVNFRAGYRYRIFEQRISDYGD